MQGVRGGAVRKTERLREMVSEAGQCGELMSLQVALPLDPTVLLNGIIPASCSVFKSAMAPIRLTFRVAGQHSRPAAMHMQSRSMVALLYVLFQASFCSSWIWDWCLCSLQRGYEAQACYMLVYMFIRRCSYFISLRLRRGIASNTGGAYHRPRFLARSQSSQHPDLQQY